jgi:hypothetical protein
MKFKQFFQENSSNILQKYADDLWSQWDEIPKEGHPIEEYQEAVQSLIDAFQDEMQKIKEHIFYSED